MKNIKFISNLLVLIFFLNSCSSFSEAGKILRNEKVKSTDEFLIKKKNPLTQPPDFDTIPKPGEVVNKADKKGNSIEKILNTSQSKEQKNSTKYSSTEKSILNQIKK